MQVYGICIRTLHLPVISVTIIFFYFFFIFRGDKNSIIKQMQQIKINMTGKTVCVFES